MNNELFEQLLYEEENPSLDFKRDQYRFARATEDEKSELLKDILGFANAWRRSDAYILIGIEDARGGRGITSGIPETEHLDDHSLQQFVNSLTNQPVRFHYEAYGFEGKQFGIIIIGEQIRPVYLKKDYGKLQKEKVYVRRGSSTDPTKPATLEEIAQMRVGMSGQSAAEMQIEFADNQRETSLGKQISLDAEFCSMPKAEDIPDLLPPRNQHPFGLGIAYEDPMCPTNRDYFRDIAGFEFSRRLYRPVRLVLANIGKVAANNVRVEMTVSTNCGIVVTSESKLPDRPKQRHNRLDSPAFRALKPVNLGKKPGEVTISRDYDQFKITIDCSHLQPGRRVWSDTFFIGRRKSGDVALSGFVFADNLPQPQEFALVAAIAVTETVLSIDELCALENY
ncbi:MAG: ATP-binding protein [Geobacter sp.]|nr:ATP-binding protein [Geobacter sp.]